MLAEKLIRNEDVLHSFEDFILEKNHPCVMAQTVFKQDDFEIHEYDNFSSLETAEKIFSDIQKYLNEYDFKSNNFRTFIAVFPSEKILTEEEFEDKLWNQLSNINKIDKYDWDPSVSNDPADSNFSFSIAGKAFYIVGMHPKSSRMARQAPFPAMVFNLHAQFEKLRDMNVYKRVRNRIRDRDIKLQGNINPVLEDFGVESEAKQYSGRYVGKEWKCPYLNQTQ